MKNIFIGIAIGTVFWFLILSIIPMSEAVVYDCSIAEVSPDIPPSVKQECRKLRYNQWKKEQDERKNEKGLYGGRSIVL